jgi:hypothetical protein
MSKPSSWPLRFFGLFGPLDDLDDLVWAVRLCPVVAAISLLLADTVFKTGIAHRISFGIAIVQLLLLSYYMFRAKNVSLRSNSSDPLFNAIWILRLFPIVAAACIALAEFAQPDFLRGLALGMSVAMFITLLTTGFQTSSVKPSELTSRDDLQQLHLNG